ncbi:MAG: translocation/assembly module TamB domain-containing protein [Bacteroidota bacterium]
MSGIVKKVARKVFRASLYLVGGLVGLFLLIWGTLQFPQTQTLVVGKITHWLSDKTKTKISIGRVDIDFFKTLVLQEVYVEDERKDTLLYTGEIKVNVGLLALTNKKIVLNLIGLDNAVVNLKKYPKDSTFNYQFIIDAFQSDTTTTTDTTSAGWAFDLEQLDFQQIRFNYSDAISGNDLHLRLQKLETDIETLGLNDKHPRINSILLDGVNVAFTQSALEADTLGAVLAKATQTDTIAAAVKQSVTEKPANTQEEDSLFNSSGYALHVGKVQIAHSEVRYEVKGAPRHKNQFDYQNLFLQELNLTLKNLVVGENDFAITLENLAFKDQSGLVLNQLAMDVKADMPRVEAHLKTFRSPNSAMDDVLLVLASTQDTQKMLRKLSLEADFEHDSLAVQDVAYFTRAFDAMPALKGKTLFMDGDLQLSNANLSFDDFRLALNEQQYLAGTLSAKNIDSLPLTEVNLHLQELKTDMGFIGQFLPPGTLPSQAKSLGHLSLKGDVVGKLSGAKTKLALTSDVGKLQADLKLRTNELFNRNFVSGVIQSDNLNAAKLVGNGLGHLAFEMQVNASQIKDQLAVQKADLTIKYLVYQGYTYQDFQLRGSYLKNLASASFSSRDTNLQLEAYASADLAKPTALFNLNAELKKIDPRLLKLSTDTLQAGLTLGATFSGTDPNKIVGKAVLSEMWVNQGGKNLSLDTVVLAASQQNNIRTVILESDIIKAGLAGQFTVEGLPLALNLLIKDYFSGYPVFKSKLTSPQNVDFSLYVKENPAIIQAFAPGLKIPQAINVKGHFASKESRIVMDGSIPLLIYQDQKVEGLVLTARTNERKLALKAEARQVVIGTNVIPEPILSGNFKKDDATFNLKLAGAKADSRLDLNGRLLIRKDTFQLRLLPSEVFLKKQKWEIAENAAITYGPQYIWIDNLLIQQGNQTITVTSQKLSASNTLLNVEIRRIDVGNIVNLLTPLGYTLGGKLYGNARVSDIFNKPLADVDVNLSEFAVNDNQIGDVSLKANKAADSEQLNLAASILGQGNDITFDGQYNTVQPSNNLDLHLNILQIKLEQFSAFTKQYMKEMQGDMHANLLIKGSVKSPSVTGSIFFDSTLINAVAINVPYHLNKQEIVFKGNQVSFNKFTIRDDDNRALVITGGVDFADLSKLILDMHVDSDAFQFLNTSEGSEQPVYGQVFATTNLTIKGPVENIIIDGNVRILDKSLIGVPILDGSNEVKQADYIHFVTYQIDSTPPPADTIRVELEPQPVKITGFTMNVRVRVDPEAVMRIVINPKSGDSGSGDILECSGKADIRVAMNPLGNMNLEGDYAIEKGKYSMTLFGVVKKEFQLDNESTIKWAGDPMNAKVNIAAIYQTRVAREGLVGNEIQNPSNARILAPVSVYLKMQGQLLEPIISFDIKIPKSYDGELDIEVEKKLTALRNNESEMIKQVFGLVALDRFIPDPGVNTTPAGGGMVSNTIYEGIGQSVSELLTSQLNKLSDDYLGGVQISVDLKSRVQDGSYSSNINDKQLGVNLSKQLFNDRLSVTVGSNVGLGNASPDANNVKNIIGDFSVQYRLVPSGILNLKFFRKVDPNVLNTNAKEVIGVSLMHSKSFNRWKDLFRNRKQRQRVIQ